MNEEEARIEADKILKQIHDLANEEWMFLAAGVPMDRSSWMDGFIRGYLKGKMDIFDKDDITTKNR